MRTAEQGAQYGFDFEAALDEQAGQGLYDL
jgi:hypothetical protein